MRPGPPCARCCTEAKSETDPVSKSLQPKTLTLHRVKHTWLTFAEFIETTHGHKIKQLHKREACYYEADSVGL